MCPMALVPFKRVFYAMNMRLGIWIWPRVCGGDMGTGIGEGAHVPSCISRKGSKHQCFKFGLRIEKKNSAMVLGVSGVVRRVVDHIQIHSIKHPLKGY